MIHLQLTRQARGLHKLLQSAAPGAASRACKVLAASVAGALLLSACSTPPLRYHTLAQVPAAGSSGALISLQQQRQPLRIEVLPVRVPERLNRSNLMLSNRDGSLRLLEQERWSAALPEELRDALSQQLQQQLGAVDTYHQSSAGAASYRIAIEVVQLDAVPGANVEAVINWTVQPLPGLNQAQATFGRSSMELPAPMPVNGVVATYRQVVRDTAADVAAAVRSYAPPQPAP